MFSVKYLRQRTLVQIVDNTKIAFLSSVKDLFQSLSDDHLGNHIAGLIDADGCFSISMQNNRVATQFKLEQNRRDAFLHTCIRDYLNCGRVYSCGNRRSSGFVVDKKSELRKTLFPFLQKYKLFTTKRLDLDLFIKAVEFIEDSSCTRIHGKGLKTVLEYATKMSLNKSWSRKEHFTQLLTENNIDLEELKEQHFNERVDHAEYMQKNKLHPAYISGFIDGEGCFQVGFGIRENTWPLIIPKPRFYLGQHQRSGHVIYEIHRKFGVGSVYQQQIKFIYWSVENLYHLENKLFNFFEQFPLLSTKRDDLQKLKKVCEMKREYRHKTQQGIKDIISISYEMNQYSGSKSRRKFTEKQLMLWLDQTQSYAEFTEKRNQLQELRKLLLPRKN